MKRVIGLWRRRQAGVVAALLGLCVLASAWALAAPPAGVFVGALPVDGPGLHTPSFDFAWSLSADGLTLYFSSNRPSNYWTQWDRFDMYEATRKSQDQPFENFRKLDELNSPVADLDPFISHDGLSLYFVSNRGGGNWDIWIARRDALEEDFVKKRVENLGPPVNTGGVESAPAVSCDEKILVFMRDLDRGHDLYMAEWDDVKGEFRQPVNLRDAGHKVNTEYVEDASHLSCDGRTLFFMDFPSPSGAKPRPGGMGLDDIWWSWRETTTEPFPEANNPGSPLCSPYGDGAPVPDFDWPAHESVMHFGTWRPHPLARGNWDPWQATWLAAPAEKVTYELQAPQDRGALNCGGWKVDAMAEIGAKFERDRFFGDDLSWSGDPESGIKVMRTVLGHVPFEKPEDGWVLGRDNFNPVDATRIPSLGPQDSEILSRLFATSAVSSKETIPLEQGIAPPERLHYRALVVPGRYEVTLYFAEGSPDAVGSAGEGARVMDVSLNGEKVLSSWSAASAAGSPTGSGDPQVLCGAALNVAIARKFSLDVPDDDPEDGTGTLDIVLEPATETPGDPELSAFRFERLGDVTGEPVSGDLEIVTLDPGSHLEEDAYQTALERWSERGELYINCGGPLLACALENPAPGATKDDDAGDRVVWIGDQVTSTNLEPVESDFFELTPLDEGLTPGLKVASTSLGAFDARGTESGLDQNDVIFSTQRQGAFQYDILVEDGTYELTLYFGNALWETAGSGKCFFRIEVEETRLSFEEEETQLCEFTGKDEQGELAAHPALGWSTLYDPFDHAERLYSSDPCNFAKCAENGIVADNDPDRDGVPTSLECGSGAATALRYQVEVRDGALTVVVGYPVFAATEPWSDGTPFLSGMSVRRPPQPPPVFHRGDVDQNGELELTDAIQPLMWLFLGCFSCRVIECEDASDADDNGSIELTDSIRILGYLFLGTGIIPPPGAPPNPCGPDPTTDGEPLGCKSYEPQHCQ